MNKIYTNTEKTDITDLTETPLWKVYPGKQTFCCSGYMNTGPDVSKLVISLVMFNIPLAIFIIFVAWPLKIYVFSIALFLTISTDINLICTAFVDPGIINPLPKQSTHANTSIIPKKKQIVKNQEINLPYCETCNMPRPIRASHCSRCNHCVACFDHHCILFRKHLNSI
eukprot:Anaeramoba_ignava/c16221_g1_i1.p1 GENE.c16221_g1_i1~~c16221_g1_i1.p1  ORF type:complete len:169 (-),score=24.01 c16221_g1_i1:144-650(-)